MCSSSEHFILIKINTSDTDAGETNIKAAPQSSLLSWRNENKLQVKITKATMKLSTAILVD